MSGPVAAMSSPGGQPGAAIKAALVALVALAALVLVARAPFSSTWAPWPFWLGCWWWASA